MSKNLSNWLVIDGGTVKTEEEGVITGLGIVFGSEKEPDQSQMRDFFTSDSVIWKSDSFTIPLFYNHGLGPIKTQIGEAVLTKSDDGWVTTAKIDLSDEIGKSVYENVKETQHGFSTGALQHLVKREAKGNNTHFLRQWVVGEISLTERPAERKAVVQSVKSVDGEMVVEDAWTPEYKIQFFDKDGNEIWNSTKSPDSFELAPHSVKYTYGSTTYSFYAYNEDTGSSVDVYVSEYGKPEDVLNKIQNLLATAKSNAEEDFDSRVEAIVSKVLEEKFSKTSDTLLNKEVSDTETSDLKSEDDKDRELAELRTQLAEREDALTKANEYTAQLEILAGAKETIDNKGK